MWRSKRVGRLLLGIALLASAALALPSTGLPPGLDDARLAILPPPVRQDVQRHADAWARMSPAEQQAFRERLRAWDALPLPVRRERRETWQAWLALPADQRLQVRAAALAYAALPPDQQQALRTEFDQADASQRRGWRLGPALGASYTVLQPLLMQVPGNERAPLLLALRAMDAAQRDALGMLAQRTAPAQRDALRRELISTSAANRGRWLDARLAR
jgi:hypothetical protein